LIAISLLGLAACHEGAKPPVPVPVPVPDAGPDCREAAIITLEAFMECKIGPFIEGRLDEKTFRTNLELLRDAYPDPDWARGDDPGAWPAIVARMLDTGSYKPSCKACHERYMKPYRAAFKQRRFPGP
jgi:hypothetical protein